MANTCSTKYVVQGPRKALFEVQHVFNGFRCNDRIFANPHPTRRDLFPWMKFDAAKGDVFLGMKFDAKKGLIIETVGRYVTHEFTMIDYIQSINIDVEVAFMTTELNTETWYKYDHNGVFDNDPDVLIFDDPDVPDADIPDVLRRARRFSIGHAYCHKKDIEGVDIPGTMQVIVCESIDDQHC